MIKKMISRLSVLAVLIVFLAACSKTSEYTNVIPADATVVVSIDMKSIANKGGFNDKENEAMKQKLTEMLKSSASAIAFQQLEKILKDPSESGFDFHSPLYFFTSPSFPDGVMVGKISSTDKAKASLEAMIKEQIFQPIEEADGYSYSLVGGNDFIAFNETAILLIDRNRNFQIEETKSSITALFKQTVDNSISNNAGFEKMQKQKGDIRLFASMEAIPKMYANQIKAGLPSNIDPKEIILLAGLSFEKGKITVQFENYTENKEVEALLKKQNEALKKLNTSFLKYFPSSTLAFLNMGIDGDTFYNNLLSNEMFRNNQTVAQAAEIKNLFSTFDGDISVGLLNVDMMKQAPAFLAYADVKNGDALKAIYAKKQTLGLKSGESIVQLSENEYVYNSRGINIFYGVKEKQFYATNDEMMYKNIGKKVDKSIKETEYASDMKDKSLFFVINTEAILELPIVKMIMGYGGKEHKIYFNLASKVSYFEVSIDEQIGEINLLLKDKNVNALKQIADLTKQYTGMQLNLNE